MLNIDTLNKYYKEGWLIKQTHPSLPLTIWNYSIATQYAGYWDEVTLQARGLVTDSEGNIVARPFKKFFNIEEGKHTPTSEFEVYEKMDGSLGILFFYKGDWIFASRGSFTSDQAVKFKEIFERKYKTSHLSVPNTYLFEIIYPENRIVVDYGNTEDIVLLGEIHTETGNELGLEYWENNIFNVVKRYNGIKDYTTLKGMIADNAEGFIVKFSNGDRMKVKGEEYVRLHKIMTEISTKTVWECLKSGNLINTILDNVPDEFFDKIKEYEKEMLIRFDKVRQEAIAEYTKLVFNVGTENRKEFALKAKNLKYPSIMFAMLDKKDWNPMIWDLVKPEFRKL